MVLVVSCFFTTAIFYNMTCDYYLCSIVILYSVNRWADSLVFHSDYNTLDAIFGSISQGKGSTGAARFAESFIKEFPHPRTENPPGQPNPGTIIEEVLADNATITSFGFAHFGI